MRIAMLAPIAWRTPPRHYGPWENVASLITEELVKLGHDVTLFATADSQTSARLHAVCPTGYEEDDTLIPKVWECLHISELFEHADAFDIIHNHFDFLPLTYSRLTNTPVVTTIHGFSSPEILPVYRKYNGSVFYTSISDSDRSPELEYIKTVHHGIDIGHFDFQPAASDTLLYFGRIHADKGTREAIEIAKTSGKNIVLAGIIQDQDYFNDFVAPDINNTSVKYIGSVGPEKRNMLLGSSSALLHPISFKEPFGLSVIESMACGTPVIAFNKGSMPELIRDGGNGFLVNTVAEAVDAVGKLGKIQRSSCRRHVEQYFTAQHMTRKYVEVYETILQKGQQL